MALWLGVPHLVTFEELNRLNVNALEYFSSVSTEPQLLSVPMKKGINCFNKIICFSTYHTFKINVTGNATIFYFGLMSTQLNTNRSDDPWSK